MTKRLYIKNNLDFKKTFSTAHAVIRLIENIKKAIDNKMLVCGVFVDLQKAFDNRHYGIRDIANCCFSSYLSNRKQFATINGFDSETQSFRCGVPQGSVLGPILF